MGLCERSRQSRAITKALNSVIPGLAEGESPEPINTCGADSRDDHTT